MDEIQILCREEFFYGKPHAACKRKRRVVARQGLKLGKAMGRQP
jgi:hypothetical protein